MRVPAPLEMILLRRIPLLKGGRSGRFLFDNIGWAVFSMSRFPLIKDHKFFNKKTNSIRCIPMNADIDLPEDAPMPIELLYRFIDEAPHHVVVTGGCGCRTVCGCENYPQEIGCLFMGDTAIKLPKTVTREVSIEEAKAHVKRAIDTGLIPYCGKVWMDNAVFAVKDTKQLLSVCFCCECCCISRSAQYMPIEGMEPMFKRLDGITVEVTDDCTGCKKCVDVCFIGAMSVPYGKAQISSYCRGCGRCVEACPGNAIKIKIKDLEYAEKAYADIAAHVDFK